MNPSALVVLLLSGLLAYPAPQAVNAPAPAAQPAAAPPAQQPLPADREPGFTFRLFQLEGDIKQIPTLAENQTPNFDQLRPKLDLSAADFNACKAPFLTHIRAMLSVPVTGRYSFRLTSDDGARLLIDGEPVVDHDGRHGATAKTSDPVPLTAGDHTLFVEHFDSGADRMIKVEWQVPGKGFAILTSAELSTDRDNARVVGPGVKKLKDARRAGDGKPVDGVHPSFKIEPIVATGFEPMVGAMTLTPDGRLIVGTFSPLQRTDTDLPDIESKVPDKLYAITGVLGDLSKVTAKVVADGLYEPLGLCAVGNDLYVSHRKEITRLRDADGDGFYESRDTIASGWEAWNYHQFTFGLLHREGKLYATLSTTMAPPGWEGMGTNAGPCDQLRGCVIEADIATKSFRVIAGGVRSPNGLGFGPEGSLFYADNQGTWMPSNQLGEVVPGRFFGHFNNTNFVPKLAERFPKGGNASVWCDRPRAPAAIDLVHNDLANSPTQSLLVESGPYKGQMLIGELTAGGIRRAFLEKVNGQWQGAVFQFSQGFNVGINRMVWGPEVDGQRVLFVGGIGAGGNWNWKGKRAGLERMTPTGKVPFEMLAVRALPTSGKPDANGAVEGGFEIEFTQPVDRAWLRATANYTVRQWNYEPSKEYGGAKANVQALSVSKAEPSADGRKVTLTIKGLLPGRTVHIRTDPVSTSGEQIWATETWYTLNQFPKDAGAIAAVKAAKLNGAPLTVDAVGVGVLPPENVATLIGRSARAMFTTPTSAKQPPTEARSQNDLLGQPEYQEMTPGMGDLTSRTSMGDCRLHVEWYCPPGGDGQMAANSGVYLQDLYEVQVLGTLAGDGPLQPSEAGSIYTVKAPDTNASTGPGTWQAYDLFFRAPRFADGKKTEPARLTAFWNGKLVHNDTVIPEPTGSAKAKGERASATDPAMQHGPLRLQEHASAANGPVRFRNVWVSELTPAPAATTPTKESEWTDLTAAANFDANWAPRGGAAEFAIKDGVITGTSRPGTPNTFLVSKQEYGDFELLLECRQHVDLNSGIQIRSHIDGGFARRDGVLRGYQVELDPSDRAYSGGIYDEGRRGWLAPLVDAPWARAAFKKGGWNQIRVIARGPLIQTWINGTPAATIFDAADRSGHLGLQVHDVGDRKDPLTAEFRNVRIRVIK